MKIDITQEEIGIINNLIENDIKSNIDWIKSSKEKDVKNFYTDFNKRLKKLRSKLNACNKQFVIQELTAEQEDYMIESQLEEIRLKKNG